MDSPSQKVVGYNIQIRESGEEYTETIEVDTEKQTELFKVPAHVNVEQSNILHDFKKNLSMMQLPEKKICYILPLEMEVSTPEKLINDLDKANRITISKKSVIENKWTVNDEVTDTSALSEEMASFCENYAIYYLKKIEDTVKSIRIQTNGKKHRQRRQQIRYEIVEFPDIPRDLSCPGGKRIASAHDDWLCRQSGKEMRVECKVLSNPCYYYSVCETLNTCTTRHVRSTISCCEYKCLPVKAA
nr:uncharacterized protein LOC131798932 [Pocillopora verrucosa]